MGLLEDAILTYSELEASFLQSQASSLSGHISWFGKLINPDPNDDSLPLLDISKKPYRDLILHNSITIFDFRVYLLAKHCEALGINGQITELARKASNFLGAFSQRLKSSNVCSPIGSFLCQKLLKTIRPHFLLSSLNHGYFHRP